MLRRQSAIWGTDCYRALCYSSKRLVSYGTMSYMNYELEYQSSASAPMICTVSLWKSSHACSDGARVPVRDSTVHHSGSTLYSRALLHARRWRVFLTVFVYYFTMRFSYVFCCLLHPVEAPSHPLTVIVLLHGVVVSCLGRAPACSCCVCSAPA